MSEPLLPGSSLDIEYLGVMESPGQDEVDRIVAAWQVERPDLDTSPMLVLSRVTRLARRLPRLGGRAAA